MILNSPDMRPTDKYLKSLLQESYTQESKHYIVKLPCSHGSIELEKPGDVTGICNTCKKPFYLVWSLKPKFKETV